MIDLTSSPSSLLRTFATLARWTLGLLLVAWLVFWVTWGALHWVIVPRIGDFRPQLEARASQLLGVTVRIGAISASSNGMSPSFELTQVQLFDAQGREALLLPRVLAALSPRSLWRLGFEQLSVDHPELHVRRTADGKITVAGLDFASSSEGGTGGAEWFFSQREFAIHGGTLLWTDEQRAAPTLTLQQVDLVVRNRGRRHDLRLDATPPTLWGERFTLRGLLTQPVLSRKNGRWQEWDGQLYGAFPRVDVPELRRYAGLGVDLQQGLGALTAWIDVSRGQLVGGTVDLALAEVRVTLGDDLEALELTSVQGRLGGRRLASGFELSTQNLQFETRDGLQWPGGNVRLMYLGPEGAIPAQGEFSADQLDLAALSRIASRLPLAPQARAQLLAHAPQGRVTQLQGRWQGPSGDLSQYQVSGQVTQLAVAAHDGVPGIRGASIDFDLDQSAGYARISLTDGALALPDWFDEAEIPVTQFSTDARWQIKGDHVALQLPNVKFSNADAAGEAQVKWESSDPTTSPARARYPGLLDLQGALSRVAGTRVHRYLPTVLDPEVRHYVRDAVQAGMASNVKFRVKGDLHHLPFNDPKAGEFRISADVKNAVLNYVPPSLQPSDALPWPALSQLSGELVIDRMQLQVKGARARIGANGSVQIKQVSVLIPNLNQAVVTVNATAQGPLAEVLGIVNNSPLGQMTGRALARAVASGEADYQLKLTLPIAKIDSSAVQGSVTLNSNDIQISPETPKLTRARGLVSFSESGFTISAGQARMLGGEVRLEGGAIAPAVIRASGTATAEGLRQAVELGFVARLAQQASGSASYTAVLGFNQGQPELLVTSSLQGLSLSLPAPLNKRAETALPLRLKAALTRASPPADAGQPPHLQDQLTLTLGSLASVVYVRDLSGPEPRVLRGSIGVGLLEPESAPLPAAGVLANINLAVLDLDAWGRVLSQATGVEPRNPAVGASASALSFSDYLPNIMAVRARDLTVGGRQLNNVVVGGSRDGTLWRANLDARELNGYLEYREPSDASAGRVYARLARLAIAPGAAREVEALLSEQPASIPALDIVVDDFELRGKRLGRLEVEAINRGADAAGAREWRLNKFNLISPAAVLTASGNWASVGPAQGGNAVPVDRRTVLNFKLDLTDSGALLTRLGMPGVIRNGRGSMEGQVAWQGSPITLDYPSMTGAFTIDVTQGQFLKADPGIAKLLGVLSLQSLPRRLTLDFRDVFSEGFTFDFVRGDVRIEEGIAKTTNLQMTGVNAAVLMEGRADIARETQDLKVVVVPEINAGTASLIASVINPAVGLGTFLAQMFLRKPLMEAATQEFYIDGPWADPRIAKVPRAP